MEELLSRRARAEMEEPLLVFEHLLKLASPPPHCEVHRANPPREDKPASGIWSILVNGKRVFSVVLGYDASVQVMAQWRALSRWYRDERERTGETVPDSVLLDRAGEVILALCVRGLAHVVTP